MSSDLSDTELVFFGTDGTTVAAKMVVSGSGGITFESDVGPITLGGVESIETDGPLNLKETGGGSNKISLKGPASIATDYDLIFPAAQGGSNQVLQNDGSGNLSWQTGGGGGDVMKAASSTDHAIVRFDGVGGDTLLNSGAILDDSNNLTGIGTLTVSGIISGVAAPSAGTDAANKTYVDGPHKDYTVTTVNTATYTLLSADEFVHVDYTSTGACTLTLPAISSVGKIVYEIIDSGGQAHDNNITINRSSTDTIIGDTSLIISENYNSVTLSNNGSDSWFIV